LVKENLKKIIKHNFRVSNKTLPNAEKMKTKKSKGQKNHKNSKRRSKSFAINIPVFPSPEINHQNLA
jgi:hypothetical protein